MNRNQLTSLRDAYYHSGEQTTEALSAAKTHELAILADIALSLRDAIAALQQIAASDTSHTISNLEPLP